MTFTQGDPCFTRNPGLRSLDSGDEKGQEGRVEITCVAGTGKPSPYNLLQEHASAKNSMQDVPSYGGWAD